MTISGKSEALKRVLEALPSVVSVGKIKIEDNIVKYISIKTRAKGRITARQVDVDDAPALFDFYFEGLFEKSRHLFVPYPLFHTPPVSVAQLAQRIKDWKTEDDWTAIKLVKDKRIIGLALLKRFRTEHVTSGIAISDKFQRLGLGHILQSIIVEQARLLDLRKFHIKVISDNLASVRLHEKCGFKQTRILPSMAYEEMLEYLSESDKKNGKELVDRQLIEMVIELNYDRKT